MREKVLAYMLLWTFVVGTPASVLVDIWSMSARGLFPVKIEKVESAKPDVGKLVKEDIPAKKSPPAKSSFSLKEMLKRKKAEAKVKKVEAEKPKKVEQKSLKRVRLDWAPGWSNPGGDPLGYDADAEEAIRDFNDEIPELVKEAFIVMVQEADLGKDKPIEERFDLTKSESYTIRNELRIYQMHSKRAQDGNPRIMEKFTVTFEGEDRAEKAYRWRVDYEGITYYLLIPHKCFNVSWYKKTFTPKKKLLLLNLPPRPLHFAKRRAPRISFSLPKEPGPELDLEYELTVFTGCYENIQSEGGFCYGGAEFFLPILKNGQYKFGYSQEYVAWKGSDTGNWDGFKNYLGPEIRKAAQGEEVRVKARWGSKRMYADSKSGKYQSGTQTDMLNLELSYKWDRPKCEKYFCKQEVGFAGDFDLSEKKHSTWEGNKLTALQDPYKDQMELVFQWTADHYIYDVEEDTDDDIIWTTGLKVKHLRVYTLEPQIGAKLFNEKVRVWGGYRIKENQGSNRDNDSVGINASWEVSDEINAFARKIYSLMTGKKEEKKDKEE